MTRHDLSNVRHWVETLLDAREKQKKYKAIEESAKDMILDEMGDAEQGLLDGKLVLIHDTGTSKYIPIADLRERYPEIAAELETDRPKNALRRAEDK